MSLLCWLRAAVSTRVLTSGEGFWTTVFQFSSVRCQVSGIRSGVQCPVSASTRPEAGGLGGYMLSLGQALRMHYAECFLWGKLSECNMQNAFFGTSCQNATYTKSFLWASLENVTCRMLSLGQAFRMQYAECSLWSKLSECNTLNATCGARFENATHRCLGSTLR